MNFLNLEKSTEKLYDLILAKVPSIVVGLLILFIGRYVIRFVLKMVDKRFHRRDVDLSIRSFIESILKFVLYALLILTAANTMGVQTTSFIALMSAFGLAVGMALQGSLSNFAGGVLILVFRPFEVGDWIDSNNGSKGTVENIDILYTTIMTDDGVRIFSPNGTLANSVIKNATKITNRRFDFSFLVSYETDIKIVRERIMSVMDNHPDVLKIPKPMVYISSLEDGGMKIMITGWAARAKQFATKNELAEVIKDLLDGQIIILPQATMKILKD